MLRAATACEKEEAIRVSLGDYLVPMPSPSARLQGCRVFPFQIPRAERRNPLSGFHRT